MDTYQVTAIFTCFNRKEKTVECINSLVSQNDYVSFRFIAVDDGSTDGTSEALRAFSELDIEIIQGDGNLYWCGGMRKGIEAFLKRNPKDDEFCLFVNDDVKFFPHSIDKMFLRLQNRNDYVVVGATCGDDGAFTYGLKAKEAWHKKNITRRIHPGEAEIIGETFNANCVLIPNAVIKKIGNMCDIYRHSLGDYDYGFQMTKNGIKLISSVDYIGVCNSNSIKGTWNDKNLSRLERFRKKESPKGSPGKEWWCFLRRNFGIFTAVKYTVLSYLRILLGK